MDGVSVFAKTDVGRVRKGNEDNFLVVDTTSEHVDSLPEIREINLVGNNNFFMVADGMGGPAAGEVASLLAVNTVLKETKNKIADNQTSFVSKIEDLLQKANNTVFQNAQRHPELKGMGTTGTLAGIFNNKLFFGQVGDSRAYIIRNNTITQVTKDQSYVGQLVKSGIITEEAAKNHPQKSLILQALGTQPKLKAAITSSKLCKNDYLLICSDGLSGLVTKEEMKAVIQSSDDIASASQQLVDYSNKKGGHDNITLIIVHFASDSLAPPSNGESVDFKTITEFTPFTKPSP